MNATRGLILILAVVCLGGCSVPEASRLNEISVENKSKDQIDKVLIHWEDRTFTFDPSKFGPGEVFSNITKKITMTEDVDAIMEIQVFYLGMQEPVEHHAKINLKMGERQLITVRIIDDQKIRLSRKQRNPDIL